MRNGPLSLMQKLESGPTLLAEIVVRRKSCNVNFFIGIYIARIKFYEILKFLTSQELIVAIQVKNSKK